MNNLDVIQAMLDCGVDAAKVSAVIDKLKISQEDRRLAWRERQRRHRAKSVSACEQTDHVTNVTVTHRDTPPSPLFPPSFPPIPPNTTPLYPPTHPVEPPQFESFWESFPRKRRGSRSETLSAYRRALGRAVESEILLGLKKYSLSDEVARGFAKGAAAWLNADRWTVEYDVSGSFNKNVLPMRKKSNNLVV